MHTAKHISSTGDKVILLNATGLGYQVMRALGRRGVRSIVIYDQETEEIGRHSRYVADRIEVPCFIEQPERLLVYLLKNGRKWSGTLIIPTKDYGVEFLARYKGILSRYYIIPTPGLDVIEGILDKRVLYENARRLGISVPETFHARSRRSVQAQGHDRVSLSPETGSGPRLHKALRLQVARDRMFRAAGDCVQEPHRQLHLGCLRHDDMQDHSRSDSKQMVQFASYIDRSGEMLASMTSRKMRRDPPRYGQDG